ncbi:MAG: adenylate/guanylate cyclase domain-containing protein, partial [Rhodospirillaceae bacterium]|nr:adenylate/guanylate cyclase domain-containing protein [Rhodospirillaceae bacterium]
SAAGDAALRTALLRNERTVLAMGLRLDGDASELSGDDIGDLALPAYARPAVGSLVPQQATGLLKPIAEFATAAKMGHVMLQPDSGGTPRAHFPIIAVGDAMLPSFPLLVAVAQRGQSIKSILLSLSGSLQIPGSDGTAQQPIELGPRLDIPLNYLGPAGTITSYPLTDLLAGRIPADVLRDKAVLIGATAATFRDAFVTPFDPQLPGVEILATATANLLADDYLRRTSEQLPLEGLLIVTLAAIAWGLGQAPGPRLGLALNLALLAGWLVLSQVMLAWSSRWLAVAGPSMGIALGAAIAVAGRMVQERLLRSEVERQRGNLARYVPPSLADALAMAEKPAFDEREQMAAILFIDLKGFTTASEIRSPSETAHFLKAFHAQIEDVVVAHRGVIAQFLGDGALILWGLPQPQPDDPALALACARNMLRRLSAWQPNIVARIGLHYGPVAMAQLGGHNQFQLAAAGDTVNVASRLESMAKEAGVVFAVSDALVDAVRALKREDLLVGLVAQPARSVRGRDQVLGFWSAQGVTDIL